MKDFRRRAQNVVNQAKENATGIAVAGANNPEGRGPRIRTGRLYDNIDYLVTESMGATGFTSPSWGPNEIVVFADTPYAVYLEEGVRGGRTYPFLSAALDAFME